MLIVVINMFSSVFPHTNGLAGAASDSRMEMVDPRENTDSSHEPELVHLKISPKKMFCNVVIKSNDANIRAVTSLGIFTAGRAKKEMRPSESGLYPHIVV